MTVALSGRDIAAEMEKRFPGSVVSSDQVSLVVKPESILPVATFLKTEWQYNFNYLVSVTAVDYRDYFELVYQMVSLNHNFSLVLKTRLYERKEPVASSVVSLWKGADFQEREIYDLFGIKFNGHPHLKRIATWEGFNGHPLRKDYLTWQ